MSNYNQAQILRVVQECTYNSNYRDYITYIIYELLTNFKNTKFQKCMRKNDGYSETIIFITVYLPVTLNKNTYEIPIIMYIPQNFPNSAPEIVVEKLTPDTLVNPQNTDIDQVTYRVMTKGLRSWNPYTQILSIINEISASFNLIFPVYNKSKTSSSSTTSTNTSNTSMYTSSSNYSGGYSGGGGISSGQGYVYNQGGGYQSDGYSPFQMPSGISTGTSSTFSKGSSGGLKKTNTIYGDLGINTNPNVNTVPTTSYNTGPYSSMTNPYQDYKQPSYSSSSAPSNMSKEDAEKAIKQILIDDIKFKVSKPLLDETRRLKSEEIKLNNFKNELNNQIKKVSEISNYKDNIISQCRNMLSTLDTENSNIKDYIVNNQGKEITKDNVLSYISVNNEQIIKIISIEATIEDLILIIKKGFDKKASEFTDAVRFIRTATRELFKIKIIKDKMLSSVNHK
jgi:hypothetical protein